MPAGHIHRRLMGSGGGFLALAQSYGALAYWPLDQASGYSTTFDSIPDVWGYTTGTGANAIQDVPGYVLNVTYQDLRLCNYTDNASAKFTNGANLPFYYLGNITTGLTSATEASFIIWIKMVESASANSIDYCQWGVAPSYLLGIGGGPYPGTAYNSAASPASYMRCWSTNPTLNEAYLTSATSPAVDTSGIFMLAYTQEDTGGSTWTWRLWMGDEILGVRNIYTRTGNTKPILTPHSASVPASFQHRIQFAGFWAGGALWFDKLLDGTKITQLYNAGKV